MRSARSRSTTWKDEGIVARAAQSDDEPTGAAFIFVNRRHRRERDHRLSRRRRRDLGAADVDAAADAIRGAKVFVTQLEQPVAAAQRGLEIARAAGVDDDLQSRAGGADSDDSIYPLCDYVMPNETEAATLTGLPVATLDDARARRRCLAGEGRAHRADHARRDAAPCSTAARVRSRSRLSRPGPVVETTGAGDAFIGGFAAALARGTEPVEAARFGCAVAGISVTRPGTAPSMPRLAEVEALLARR